MPSSVQRWSMSKRIGMLFVTVYLFFLVMDFTSSDELFPHFFYTTIHPWVAFWDWIVPWTGKHILHVGYAITVKPNGSGDTTYNYVMQFCWVVLALLVAIVWAILDRKRPGYERLYAWVRVVARYYFAYILFTYGFVKVIKLQFPSPSMYRLTQPLGNMSPMGLAWTFIGYSTGYNLFTGGAEVLAGILLLFRRTTLLGSLVALSVMVNVVAINFAYDIPVKIYSVNLALLAVFIAAQDWDRLKAVFLLNTPVPAAPLDRRFDKRGTKLLWVALKVLFVFLALYYTFWTSMREAAQFGDLAPKQPLYGIYDVLTVNRKGLEVPPLTTDTSRWKRMIVSGSLYVRIINMADSSTFLRFKVDTLKRSAVFTAFPDTTFSFSLAYVKPDSNHLVFSGMMYGDSVSISMKRVDPDAFRLVSRGFHWINEYPFNR
jgi:uncharacterized membrane protein YphA (DoxX/SURF4 family)